LEQSVTDYGVLGKEIGISFWKGKEDDELLFELTKLGMLDQIWKYILSQNIPIDSRIIWTV